MINSAHTQAFFLETVACGLSQARLDGYKRYSGDSDFDCLLRYLWNSKLSESLYILLQNLEVALRNRMHDALTLYYRTEYWFDRPSLLREYQQNQVMEAKRKVRDPRAPAGKIVAELSFGFWAALIAKKYAASLVPALLRFCFSQVDRPYRQQQYLANVLDGLRQLRNRIFHHEPVWYYQDLPEKHRDALQLILWLSPELFRMSYRLSRFREIYSQGTFPYKTTVKGAMQPSRIFSW
ncbi:MAG: Abi family protein [Desulfovibrio sp.]